MLGKGWKSIKKFMGSKSSKREEAREEEKKEERLLDHFFMNWSRFNAYYQRVLNDPELYRDQKTFDQSDFMPAINLCVRILLFEEEQSK